ncbi:isocitrate/isopropylmalate family dehydrogenase [Kitasatospora sp. NPDC096147]|uniref:isocitrate/isopropylmalate family dehydrogenase n=1 Tax=Kitasatospora sp. NPDC096147 TaxID=3364093 RepID=UPI003827EE6F
MDTARIALAVGRGTGAELATVFERVLHRIARQHGVHVDILRSPRTYHSYASLRAETDDTERAARLTQQDAAHYETFCREQAAAGTQAVFRTAVNAQSLYLVREHLAAVKVEELHADGARLLLVRDQAQGFYTGANLHTLDRVVRTTEFSRAVTRQVVRHAVLRARRAWPDSGPATVVMAYKHHLLDGALDNWTAGLADELGVEITLYQPDTVNRNLIAHGLRDRTVLVAGNEWADIMHVVLLDRFGFEQQERRFTENTYLHPDLHGLTEYQTVHGSADDLAGRDLVNPVATIRAAARIAEQHARCPGASTVVETALAAVHARGVRTPDFGGTASTTQVLDTLLSELDRPPGPAVPAPAGPAPVATALPR